MTNPFTKTKIEFHILQSFPVTCLNRDDVGAPKSAIVGGVPRARVSSQCWKRQVRLALHDSGVRIALRTKHIEEKIAAACHALGAADEEAASSGHAIASALSTDTLLFMSEAEIAALAAYAKSKAYKLPDNAKDKKFLKDIATIVKKTGIKAADGLDIALFGRMVANLPDINIEAASSFSHAISTHRVSPEIEFFTALDDVKADDEENTGSGHMGSLEFNSATYYRYVCLDLGQLADTLGGEGADLKADMKTAVTAFIKALWTAVPAARQHTQAGYSGWDYARVLVRTGQPLQCSFEQPVSLDREHHGGYLDPSRKALDNFLDTRERMSGSLFGKKADYKLSPESGSVDELIDSVLKAML